MALPLDHPAGVPPLRDRIRMALAEDLDVAGDVTTRAVFNQEAAGRAQIIAKADGVICGLDVATIVFEEVGQVLIEALAKDGDRIKKGDVVMKLEGRLLSLLSGERLALNFLQQLSGVATRTAEYVDAVNGRIDICDTRKTTPLWRDLEKYAVRCGGGTNHRMGLYDMIMLKDTHADGANGLANALKAVASLRPGLKVAAEARDMGEVEAALAANVDLIMLDNMDRETLLAAIKRIDNRIPTEVTGGVTIEAAREIAHLGINRISVGALTHSAPALDLSMRLTEWKR